jgi:hypothetical protein
MSRLGAAKLELLRKVANTGEHGYATDSEGRPPSKVMKPLLDKGLVYLHRKDHHESVHGNSAPIRHNYWFLTDKGKERLPSS